MNWDISSALSLRHAYLVHGKVATYDKESLAVDANVTLQKYSLLQNLPTQNNVRLEGTGSDLETRGIRACLILHVAVTLVGTCITHLQNWG